MKEFTKNGKRVIELQPRDLIRYIQNVSKENPENEDFKKRVLWATALLMDMLEAVDGVFEENNLVVSLAAVFEKDADKETEEEDPLQRIHKEFNDYLKANKIC